MPREIRDRVTHPFSFGAGYALDAGRCYVVAEIDILREVGVEESEVMSWSERDGWSGRSIPWPIVRIWQQADPFPSVCALGPTGMFSTFVGTERRDEIVDETDEGPRYQGALRTLESIGSRLYAAGMSRQVYRRETDGVWSRQDAGVVQQPGDLSVAGFNSIAGRDEGEIYAVGFDGEIWRRATGAWRQVHSPTDVVLHKVIVADSGAAYACGQSGVLLRGQGDRWGVLPHDIATEDLWDAAWYAGNLYLSSEGAIYRLRQDDLERVSPAVDFPVTYRYLHSAHDALWSFGPKHVLRFDGRAWDDVTPS